MCIIVRKIMWGFSTWGTLVVQIDNQHGMIPWYIVRTVGFQKLRLQYDVMTAWAVRVIAWAVWVIYVPRESASRSWRHHHRHRIYSREEFDLGLCCCIHATVPQGMHWAHGRTDVDVELKTDGTRTRKKDFAEVWALSEPAAKHGHVKSFSKHDPFKVGASVKGGMPNCFDRGWEVYFFERRAVLKCPFPNGCQLTCRRNHDTLKARAVCESAILNRLQRIWADKLRQLWTRVKTWTFELEQRACRWELNLLKIDLFAESLSWFVAWMTSWRHQSGKAWFICSAASCESWVPYGDTKNCVMHSHQFTDELYGVRKYHQFQPLWFRFNEQSSVVRKQHRNQYIYI